MYYRKVKFMKDYREPYKCFVRNFQDNRLFTVRSKLPLNLQISSVMISFTHAMQKSSLLTQDSNFLFIFIVNFSHRRLNVNKRSIRSN